MKMINRLRALIVRLGLALLKLYVLVPFALGWITGRLWGLGRITKESVAEGFESGNEIKVVE